VIESWEKRLWNNHKGRLSLDVRRAVCPRAAVNGGTARREGPFGGDLDGEHGHVD